jgi:type IV pilus assembly protein PilX
VKASRRAQQGVVMWVAVIVLIVMSLAGLAMLRQMTSGVSIAGNVAFKQNATSTADAGTEAGRRQLLNMTAAARLGDSAADGYYATWGANNDPTTFDWAGHSVAVNLDVGTNNAVRFIVHRLCMAPGEIDALGQRCSDLEDSTGASKSGGLANYNPGAPSATSFRPYFRVTTQVTGPRNTISYTQVILD